MKRSMSSTRLRAAFVDHSGLPGGGQLGLARYLNESTAFESHLFVLGRGETFRDWGRRSGRLHVLSNGASKLSAFSTMPKLHRALIEVKPDVIIANSVLAGSIVAHLPRKSAPRRIYYMRDDMNPVRNSRAKLTYLSSLVIPKYDGILANSKWTASTLPKQFRQLPIKVAYPVSGLKTTAASPRQHHRPLRLLSLSRLAAWKGIHVVLEAASLLEAAGYTDQFTLTICGSSVHEDPTYEERLRKQARGIRSSVQFTGHLDNISSALARADVLLCCSTTPEPFGQVVAQGLAAGLATIATNAGGPKELIENGMNGLLVAPSDARQLAAAIARLIEHGDFFQEISRRAISTSFELSDENTVAALDSAIRDVYERIG